MFVNTPLITAVIPTYRRPQLLKRALLSVLRQTYENFQVCVYDNASGDETETVVQELARSDSRIKYYCHEENIGASANISYGVAQVSTPFFSLLSDDDVILPTFYQEMLGNFERFPQAMFSAGSIVIMTPHGEVIDVPLFSWKRDGYFIPPEGLFQVIGGKHPIIIGILFRREVIDIFQGMDPRMIAADLDLELRIAARFPFVVSKNPCGIFMYHSSATGARADTSYMWPDCLKIGHNIIEDKQVPRAIQDQARQALDRFFGDKIFSIGLRSAIRGDFVDARKAVNILRLHYRLSLKSSLLEYVANIIDRYKVMYILAVLVFDMVKYLSRRRNRNIQKLYGYLSEFL